MNSENKDSHQIWKDLIKQHGEQKARQLLSDALKEASEIVLTKDYPDVYGCVLEKDLDFIYTISVTLSYPWPG